MAYYLPWLANSSGGSDAYTWYTDLDKSTIPFHAGAGDWGVQSTIKEAAAPTGTMTDVNASTYAELAAQIYTPNRRITITGDITAGTFIAGDITDVDIIIPSGRVLANINIGAFDGSTNVQRLRFRGSTFGSYGSGGQLHQLKMFAPVADIIIDGLDLTGPGGNAGCISIERVNFSRTCARMSVTNCKGNSGGWIYFGDMADTVWANCSFLTGSDTVDVAEAWGWRFDARTGGNTVIYKVDCRSNLARSSAFYPRVRFCPHDSASPQYAWMTQNLFDERGESYILWQSSQSGNSGVDEGNLLGSWFLNNTVHASNGIALLSVRDCLYARVTNNTFYSDTFTSNANITDNDAAPIETGPTDSVKTPNTYNSLAAPSAWIGPGDPSGLDWSSY